MLRWLLRLLPQAFRREYGPELLDTAAAQWREVRGTVGWWGRGRFWVRQWYAAVRAARDVRRGPPAPAELLRRRTPGVGYGWWVDVKQSAGALAARPGFTAVAVLTLGLGVGATTAMYSTVRAVLFRPLPYQEADRVVVLRQRDAQGGTLEPGVSAANLRDLSAETRAVTRVSMADAHGLRLVEGGRAYSLRGWLVSEDFFAAIGAEASMGRTFRPAEYLPGGAKVVVLGHGTWQTRFGADPAILGRRLVLDGAPHVVVGVLGPRFSYPSAADVWAPRPPLPGDANARSRAGMRGVARLAPGATLADAQAEVDRVAAGLAERFPIANARLEVRVIPLRQHLFGEVASPMLLLLGAVGLVLLIAAANVAGLQLARGTARRHEYALRAALGASAGRMLRLGAIESLLLAGAGGLLGTAIAYVGVELVRAWGLDHLPRIDELAIDGPVLGFALIAALASAVLAGLVPAIRATRVHPHVVLAGAGRGSTPGRRVSGFRDRLVAAEIALALMLTIGAGLLVRSLDRLLDNELGFVPEHRLAAQVWAYDDDHRSRLDFFEHSVAAIAALPGVEAVGLTSDLPLADGRSLLARPRSVRVSFPDARNATGNDPSAGLVAIDTGYVQAMGIALLVGRNLSDRDRAGSPAVALVNETFARRHFRATDAVGQRVTLRGVQDGPFEIIGVVADVRRQGYASEPRPEVYVALAQRPGNGLTLVVKTTADPSTMLGPVQAAMWSVDPTQATWAARTVTDLLGDWSRQRRFNTALLVAFAGLALSLAGIGVYGLMAFSVEQRVRELGIRLALGGGTAQLRRMVLRRSLRLAAGGVGLGLVGALALTRVLRGMLYGIETIDPLTFGGVSVVVVGIAVLAAVVPARRAARIDPIVALRRS